MTALSFCIMIQLSVKSEYLFGVATVYPYAQWISGSPYERRENVGVCKNEVHFGEGGQEFMKHRILELIQVLMFYLYTWVT